MHMTSICEKKFYQSRVYSCMHNKDQVYSNTRVPTQVSTNQHEPNTSQHESTQVRHESTRVRHESTQINTSLTRVNTNQHESDTSPTKKLS